jgi:hypothetical protein
MTLLRALLLFAFWAAFLGVGIWLLIRFFRNGDFLAEHRVWRRVVQAFIVLLVVGLPWLALIILLIIEFSTRSRGDPERKPLLTRPSVDGAPHGRRLPFPPPRASEDAGPEA